MSLHQQNQQDHHSDHQNLHIQEDGTEAEKPGGENKPLPRPSKVRCWVSGMSRLVIRGGPLECRCIASGKGFRGAGCFVPAISGQRNPRQIDKVGPAAKRYARGKVWFLEARI